MDQADVIRRVLQTFCECSGQKVSLDKTRVYFSENVTHSLKVLRDQLGFQFVIDQVTQRLSTWKAKNLSIAGRLTLTKLDPQALPTYFMQSCIIPKGVCDEIDKLCRGFIWGEEKIPSHHLRQDLSTKERGQIGIEINEGPEPYFYDESELEILLCSYFSKEECVKD